MTDMQYYSLLTNSGHQANIKAKALGLPIVLSKVAFGSGNIIPTESATRLAKEEIRVNISSVVQNETDKNILEIEAVIPSDVGGFMINEAALYLEDETLYAIINLPASYKPSIEQGAGKEFVFTILLASVGVENVTLKIDDSIVFATRKYVQNELKKYALINGDENKKFKVADAEEDDEAINKKQLSEATNRIGLFDYGYEAKPYHIIAFGGEFNRADYPLLWSWIQGKSFLKTETQWQNEASVNGGICGFYSSGNGTTTFRVPNLNKAFLRPGSRTVGSFQGDAIRNMAGNFIGVIKASLGASGVFAETDQGTIVSIGSGGFRSNMSFDASRVVPTSDENRPINIAVLPLIVAK